MTAGDGRFKPRPTTYKGIQMRSRLEAGFAAWLDQFNVDWQYEPCAFASEFGQYLPDFRLNDFTVTGTARTVYIEVKPSLDALSDAEIVRIAKGMRIIHESEPEARCFLVIKERGSAAVDGQPVLIPSRKFVMDVWGQDPEKMRVATGYTWSVETYYNPDPRTTLAISKYMWSPWADDYWTPS